MHLDVCTLYISLYSTLYTVSWYLCAWLSEKSECVWVRLQYILFLCLSCICEYSPEKTEGKWEHFWKRAECVHMSVRDECAWICIWKRLLVMHIGLPKYFLQIFVYKNAYPVWPQEFCRQSGEMYVSWKEYEGWNVSMILNITQTKLFFLSRTQEEQQFI